MKYLSAMILVMTLAGCTTSRWGQGINSCSTSCGASCQNSSACSSHCESGGWVEACSCLGIGSLYTDECKTKLAAKHLANKHLPAESCNDYKDGFRQAFVDVAMGACGQVPAIAPQKYWKYCDRTANGHAAAQSWFAGYQAGAQVALGYRDRFLNIATSQQCGYQQYPSYGAGFNY